MSDSLTLLESLERSLPGIPPPARLAFAQLRQALAQEQRALEQEELRRTRLLNLLNRSARLAELNGTERVAVEMLDLLIAACDAERGLVALVAPDGQWSFIGARSMRGADLEDPEAHVSRTVVREALEKLEPVLLTDALRDLAQNAPSVWALRVRSVACVPLTREGRALGFVYVDHRGSEGHFDKGMLTLMQAFAPLLSAALDKSLRQATLQDSALPGVLTCSESFAAQLRALARIARFDVPVLLTGETGSGKGHIARQLHLASPRGSGPFVHINLGALPESLIESELFGVEAGAYTGARVSRPGRFEVAGGGTIFLDELDSASLAVQAKLLVALQERTVTRLGGHRSTSVNVRVMAAMGRSPEEAFTQGRLREDLFYRLSVVVARVPPLRERREDLELLAAHALRRARIRHGLPELRFGPKVVEQLRQHDWPGNVRELENVVERAALLAEQGTVHALALEGQGARVEAEAEPLDGASRARRMVISREEFVAVWESCGGDVGAVARRLDIARRSVYRLKQRHGL